MADVEELLSRRLGLAFDAVAGESVSPAVRRSQHADFQADGALALGRKLGISPREAAERVLRQADLSDLCSRLEVTGPGFISLTLADEVLGGLVAEIAGDDRLGVVAETPETVRYRLLRSERRQGDARRPPPEHDHRRRLARVLAASATRVIRQNHLGDWGTPFGMLIEHLLDIGETRRPRNSRSAI